MIISRKRLRIAGLRRDSQLELALARLILQMRCEERLSGLEGWAGLGWGGVKGLMEGRRSNYKDRSSGNYGETASQRCLFRLRR